MKGSLLEDVKEDCLVWKEEIHRNYSVKMRYNLLKKDLSASLNLRVEGGWGSLWKIIAPPRVTHLLWRICRGCLPTRIRLRQHLVQRPNDCQLCEDNEEDDMHVFFECSTTNRCWIDAGLNHIISPKIIYFNNAKSILLEICIKEDRNVTRRVDVMLWGDLK